LLIASLSNSYSQYKVDGVIRSLSGNPVQNVKVEYSDNRFVYTDEFGVFIIDVPDTTNFFVKVTYQGRTRSDVLNEITINDLYAAKNLVENHNILGSHRDRLRLGGLKCGSQERSILEYKDRLSIDEIESIVKGEYGVLENLECFGIPVFFTQVPSSVSGTKSITMNGGRIRQGFFYDDIYMLIKGDFDDSSIAPLRPRSSNAELLFNRLNETSNNQIVYSITSNTLDLSSITAIELSLKVPESFSVHPNDESEWITPGRMELIDFDYVDHILSISAVQKDNRNLVTEDFLFKIHFPLEGGLNNSNRDSTITLIDGSRNRMFIMDSLNQDAYQELDIITVQRSTGTGSNEEQPEYKITRADFISSSKQIRTEFIFEKDAVLQFNLFDINGISIPLKVDDNNKFATGDYQKFNIGIPEGPPSYIYILECIATSPSGRQYRSAVKCAIVSE